MAGRAESLAAVRARLERFAAERDPSVLLQEQTLIEAGQLADVLGDEDVEGRLLLGRLHWYLSQLLPEDLAQNALRLAVVMFTPCFLWGIPDDQLPEPLLPLLADEASAASTPVLQQVVRSADLATLDAVIAVWRRILDHTSADRSSRAGRLSNMGTLLWARFKRTGAAADLDATIAIRQEAVQNAAADHPGRAVLRENLVIALFTRFERTGAAADLDAAIATVREAVQNTPADDPDHTASLGNLGIFLRARFERTGAVADLDAAIETLQEAVQNTPADHPDYGGRLGNLGAALFTRSERTGARRDLDTAIAAVQEAVLSTPVGHPDHAKSLSNLGIFLRARFERTGAAADLEMAIATLQEAVETTPAGPDHDASLGNLGIVLRARYERTGTVADLDTAIATGREAVQATPADHPDYARYLGNLGNALFAKFEQTGTVADLDAAIAAFQEAVQTTPADHPDHAGRLGNLGNALRARFEKTDARADQEAAVAMWVRAARVDGARPSVRVRAGHAAGTLLAESDPARAARLLEGAVRLLPEVAPRGLDRSDQQDLLADLAGLASATAALALTAPDLAVPGHERAGRALGLLEAARGMLIAQVLETRTDLTELRLKHPDLAARFTEVRDLLDQPQPASALLTSAIGGYGPDLARPPVRDRRSVAAELATLLEQIRSLEGFTAFALPPPIEALRGQAAQGPVVTFNISSYRSDALLLTSAAATALPLPALTPETVTDQVNIFYQALNAAVDATHVTGRVAAQHRIRDVLAWLWDEAAGPVLDALGYTSRHVTGTEWPRVWWAPGGLLSLLPLHAAGHHLDPADPAYQTRTVLDRVISSYTPTIAALRHARRPAALPLAPDQTLIVAMPTTPGLGDDSSLTAVGAESTQLRARLPRPTLLIEPDASAPDTQTVGTDNQIPTRTAVFAYLPDATIAHFACHGLSHPTDPSQSLLLLHDWQHDPLTVSSLTRLNLDHARLAYLGACSTAVTRNTRLLDEAIHLASAFQLAGFPHVIGTFWEIDDHYATHIATTFYDRLTDNDGNLDPGRAADALHSTIRDLRHQLPLTPSLWAAHLHAGA